MPSWKSSVKNKSSKLVQEKIFFVNLYIGLVKSDSFCCKYKQGENFKNVFNQQYYFSTICKWHKAARYLYNIILLYVLHPR